MFLSEPRFLIDYIQNLKSSERSLKEQVWALSNVLFDVSRSKVFMFQTCSVFLFQLEIAKRKEASCIVQYAKREQEMAELKVYFSRNSLPTVHMFS